jgi:hypothetical protein
VEAGRRYSRVKPEYVKRIVVECLEILEADNYRDCEEINIAGNGVNSNEAMSTLRGVLEEAEELQKIEAKEAKK